MWTHLLWTLFMFTLSDGKITVCLKNKNHLQSEVSEEPLLSEFYIPHFDLDFKHPAISAKGHLDNLTIDFVDGYDLVGFKIVELFNYQIFNLTIHNISLVGQYNLHGNIGELFDIYGKGDFWMNLLDFSVSTFASFPKFNASGICLDVDISIDLQKEQGYLSNFMGDEEMEILMNEAFHRLIPEIIPFIFEDLKRWNHNEIEKRINDLINKSSMLKIVEPAFEYFKNHANIVPEP